MTSHGQLSRRGEKFYKIGLTSAFSLQATKKRTEKGHVEGPQNLKTVSGSKKEQNRLKRAKTTSDRCRTYIDRKLSSSSITLANNFENRKKVHQHLFLSVPRRQGFYEHVHWLSAVKGAESHSCV